jgi:triphosphoribosyl-dephospho-CoA synthase
MAGEVMLKDGEKLERIAALALEAMLFEVSATPKPGLVDRANNGAHHDMDFFTFMASAAALHTCFDRLANAGYAHRNEPVGQMLPILRSIGGEEERKMFSFTHGVNTHKGMIFSLGLLSAVAGWALDKPSCSAENLCALTGEMCRGICDEFRDVRSKENLTKGERVFLAYGILGARGEVEGGYQSVIVHSLPLYRALRSTCKELNVCLVQTLLCLVAHTMDSNIVSRHDLPAAEYAQEAAKEVLAKGGFFTQEGRNATYALDEDFTERNISPGGCADLLAVTHFLYAYEETGL